LFETYLLLNSILQNLTDAMVVVDKALKVKYYNPAFAELFNKINETAEDEEFGISIGCKRTKGEPENKYARSICANCKLRLSMLAAFRQKCHQEKSSVVLEFEHDENNPFRLLQFQASYMEYSDEPYVILLMNDLTKLGRETLTFIDDFHKKQE